MGSIRRLATSDSRHESAPDSGQVALSYPSRRYRSALMGIAVHSTQTVHAFALTLSLVLGG